MIDAAPQPERFCRSCLHSLRGIHSRKCPECGREFDPGDLQTTFAQPHHEANYWLGPCGRALIRASIALAIIAFVASALGFDRPRLMQRFPCVFAFAIILLVFTFAAHPRVEMSRRLRLAGFIFPVLFISIDLTHWPLLLGVQLCRPWGNAIAGAAQATAAAPRSTLSDFLGIRRGRVLANGNVGFHLVGGAGGGVYLVRRAGPLFAEKPERVWYNTNWEINLGDDWYLVYED